MSISNDNASVPVGTKENQNPVNDAALPLGKSSAPKVSTILNEILTYPEPVVKKKGKSTSDMPKHLSGEQY